MTDPAPGRARAILAATRPPFLILAPVTVLVGVGTAAWGGAAIQPWPLAATLIGALAAHVAVNTLNEYQDFRSGLDQLTERTPFSGGSGALPTRPAAARGVLLLSLAALLVTLVAGLYLVWLRGPLLLAIGLAGLAIIVSYTRWLNRHPWACLLAPGVGFGLLMVIGSHLALGGTADASALLAGLVVLCVACNLLLFNQYPDMAADRAVGRRTLPLVYGVATANRVYAVLLASAAFLLNIGVGIDAFPPAALAAALPLLAGVGALHLAGGHRGEVRRLLPALGLNVATAVATPLVLGVALLAAAP